MKISKLELNFFNWYGLKNKNTCLFEAWIPSIKMFGLANCGLTILPLLFWDEIGLWYKKDYKRFYLGLGLFSFFVSFKK